MSEVMQVAGGGAAVVHIASELGLVALHTTVIYLFLIVTLALLGRRQSSELTAMELVIIMVLGSSVETAMVAGDTSLLAGLTSAATLLGLNRFFSDLLKRFRRLHEIFLGRPIPLVYRGRFLPARLREAGLTEDDVYEGMRERGYADASKVRLAVLEIDGSISVVPFEKKQGA